MSSAPGEQLSSGAGRGGESAPEMGCPAYRRPRVAVPAEALPAGMRCGRRRHGRSAQQAQDEQQVTRHPMAPPRLFLRHLNITTTSRSLQ